MARPTHCEYMHLLATPRLTFFSSVDTSWTDSSNSPRQSCRSPRRPQPSYTRLDASRRPSARAPHSRCHESHPESLPTALDLLHRLPTLLPLTAEPPTVTLDTLDVLKRESRRRAHVLWVGPSQPEPLFSQINQIFRDEGFITDTRPLKLHMTLMNSTYRRPRTKRPQPFEYDTILRQAGVLESFGVQEGEYVELPMAVSMGSYEAPRIHLCKMGSWGKDGAYVSCGSAPLSKESV